MCVGSNDIFFRLFFFVEFEKPCQLGWIRVLLVASNNLPCNRYLVKDVPEQHAYYPVIAHVEHDTLAIPLSLAQACFSFRTATAAAVGNHCDVVGYLLKQPGIEVDKAKTDDGATPLYVAAEYGHGDVVKQLIAAKADVNKAKTDDGATPLYVAAEYGYGDAVKQLIAAKADINAATTDGDSTPLDGAKEQSHTEIVAMLVAAGAN